MKNELLTRWAEVMGPYYEKEMHWYGSFFNPPSEAMTAVAETTQVMVLTEDERSNDPRLDPLLAPIRARWDLVKEYAWAVPTDEALEAIAMHSPNGVVEIGAGTGYWAGLLRARGVPVVAYDCAPYNNFQAAAKWSEVKKGAPVSVLKHPEQTLFLCWPPYDTDMATTALRRYKGTTVAYVGEGPGGATADDEFHEILESEWEEIECVSLPQWPGIHDRLYIYRRTS